MKRLLIWWRTRVHWFWRWSFYLELAIVLFYLFEDARGALAWRSFTSEQPQFAVQGDGLQKSLQANVVTKELSVTHLVDFPDEWDHWKSKGMRTAYFDRRKWRERGVLNFPLERFRSCASWDLASQFQGSTLPPDVLAEFKSDPLFLELEATYRSDIEGYFPLDDPDKQALLFFVIRWQLLRAQALWQLEQPTASKQLLLHSVDLIQYLNDGCSIERSNQATDDVMLVLQIVWQYLNQAELFTDEDLSDIQSSLEEIQFLSTADRSTRFWAIDRCVQLDELKWRVDKRVALVTRAVSLYGYGGGSIEQCAHAFYQLWVPNGWIEHSKINVCRNAQRSASLGHHVDLRWEPTQLFVEELNDKLDARPTEAFVRCALVAIAVQRYFKSSGQYPQNLIELVPAFLKEVPKDPYAPDDELIYRVENDRPVIYSIGPNKVDDVGTPRAPIAEGDIVWRYQLPEGFTYRDYSVY